MNNFINFMKGIYLSTKASLFVTKYLCKFVGMPIFCCFLHHQLKRLILVECLLILTLNWFCYLFERTSPQVRLISNTLKHTSEYKHTYVYVYTYVRTLWMNTYVESYSRQLYLIFQFMCFLTFSAHMQSHIMRSFALRATVYMSLRTVIRYWICR